MFVFLAYFVVLSKRQRQGKIILTITISLITCRKRGITWMRINGYAIGQIETRIDFSNRHFISYIYRRAVRPPFGSGTKLTGITEVRIGN